MACEDFTTEQGQGHIIFDVKDKHRYLVELLELAEGKARKWGVYIVLQHCRTAVALFYEEDEARHIGRLLNAAAPDLPVT